MSFLFSSPLEATITLEGEDKRKKREKLPLYTGSENVAGTVELSLKPGKTVQHKGVKLELIGQIELAYDRGNHHVFCSREVMLEEPGVLNEPKKSYQFIFEKVDKPYETYTGINVRVRYFVRFMVMRGGMTSSDATEKEFWLQNYQKAPEINNPIKMEVGIEDCLHIEFEYNRTKYHLKDAIIGKIYFILVRIRVRCMEISLIKRETTGTGANLYTESEPITKFEIMDGAPVRGEAIPIRLFLEPFPLTPTYRNVQNKYSVRYYVNLVLIDEDDRRYFKQQEIALWRKRTDRAGRKNKTTKKSYAQYERGETEALSGAAADAAIANDTQKIDSEQSEKD